MNAAGVEGVEEITEAERDEEPEQETKTKAEQNKTKTEQTKPKLTASFGIFVGNTGGRVIDDRTRGSRMASGNFTTKPMMLWMSITQNHVATPTRTYVQTHHAHVQTYRHTDCTAPTPLDAALHNRAIPCAMPQHTTTYNLQPTTSTARTGTTRSRVSY